MHPRSPLESVEVFHLLFLKALETRLDRRTFVVKGGVNLRAWFGSARYSEDLDLDAVSGDSHVLRDCVDETLTSKAFQMLLKSQELSLARSSKPKQMETTQRWKFEIQATGTSVPLHTKLEFSRRGSDESYLIEPVRADILRPYGLPCPTVNHYTAPAAVRQKIGALTGRREPQARDIWDLDHLLRTIGADPKPIPLHLKEDLPAAIERIYELSFEIFHSQVVPYLNEEHQELYGSTDAWDRMRESVIARLEELKS